MAKNNKFKFGDKIVKLNEQQLNVVYEDIYKNILIIACAGSGKTTTILCRIKHLIDSGIEPESIVLTTFTRDATNDMKKKLEQIFGHMPNIEVGTIDSLALKNLHKYGAMKKKKIVSVSEYSIYFYNFLKDNPNKIKYLENKKYLFVDEFQDINDIQAGIIEEFYKFGVNIVAVGDDAQNIYSFRGSKIDHILNFTKNFNNVVQHKLIINYRSTPEIVSLANESIENNKYQIPKKMMAFNKSIGELPTVKFYYSWNIQNVFIKSEIVKYINEGYKGDNIAILSRTNAQLIPLEEILTKNHIKNIYLDNDKADTKKKIKDGHVTLCTIHKAKGLEWDIVFIIGLNDYGFPSNKNPIDLEEERRLFYVAVTRAKKYLHMGYTPYSKTVFVSRFISELDKKLYKFTNYKPKYIGLSEGSHGDNDYSVTKLIENLDGCDFIKLREAGVLDIEIKNKKLYDKFEYENFIKENDLYSDFGIFVDCMITRMFGETNEDSHGLHYEPALLSIANLKLDLTCYEIYKKYKLNFIFSLDKIEDTDSDEEIIEKLESVEGLKCEIQDIHKPYILDIINGLFVNAKKYNLPFYKIPVFTERYLPEDFEEQMEEELINFTNGENKSNNIINSIWEISKCDKIVKEGRRRLLYKHFDLDNLKKYNKMFDNVKKTYIDPNKRKNVECHKNLRIKCGIFGEADIIINDMIVDIKTSKRTTTSAEWILQVLCYVYMCRENNIKINKIQIFNPLNGLIHTSDVSKWDKGEILIKFLLEKRRLLAERTKMMTDLQNGNNVNKNDNNNENEYLKDCAFSDSDDTDDTDDSNDSDDFDDSNDLDYKVNEELSSFDSSTASDEDFFS